MYLSTYQNIEHHSNGKVKYIETIAIIAPHSVALYPNRRTHPNGYDWIRINENAKYNSDGTLVWLLSYDNYGNVIKPG